ncbi:MAG: metalloregulator ArsR/SmtB family transcription factor [Hyphomonadaceae bacterium]
MDSRAAPPSAAALAATGAHRSLTFEEMQGKAGEATILLKSMANETRLMILCQLVDGERSVAQLLETIPLGQSALSQHLAVLRRERLVTSRREAQSMYYSLASREVHAIIQTLYELFCGCD